MAVEGNPVQKQVTLEEVVYENQHPVKIYPKEYPMDKKVELLKRANDAAKAYDEHISKVMASLIDEEQHVQLRIVMENIFRIHVFIQEWQ